MSNSRSVSYDVIYDESDADGEDEEDGVTGDRVVGAPRVSPGVSCAARLNLARCLFKASMYSEVTFCWERGGVFIIGDLHKWLW